MSDPRDPKRTIEPPLGLIEQLAERDQRIAELEAENQRLRRELDEDEHDEQAWNEDQRAKAKAIAEGSNSMMRWALGDSYGHLWGPHLERLGAAFDAVRTENAELTAQVEVLRGALQPFADAFHPSMLRALEGARFVFQTRNGVDIGVTPGDLGRAVTALAATPADAAAKLRAEVKEECLERVLFVKDSSSPRDNADEVWREACDSIFAAIGRLP